MTWEWVAPVCTACVGVAGIAATFWTGRQSRNTAAAEAAAQRQDARDLRLRDEKRQAYLDFLETASDAMRVLTDLRALRLAAEPDREELRRLGRVAVADLRRSREQVRLVGPPSVRKCARELHEGLQKLLFAARNLREDLPKLDSTLNARLVAQMKVDLGYELAVSDYDALLFEVDADSLRTEDAS